MRAREALAAGALAVSMLVAGAGPATALGVPDSLDCKEAPVAARADTGMAGWFDKGDGRTAVADPFADPDVSVFDAYGWSGLQFHVYDLGCKPSAKMLAAPTVTALANLLLGVATFGLAATFAALGAALDPTWLSLFDPVVTSVVDSLSTAGVSGYSVAGLVFGLGALITAVAVAASRRAGNLPLAGSALGKVIVVIAIIGGVIAGPLAIGAFTDRAVVSAVEGSSGAVAGLTGGAQRRPGDVVAGLVGDKIVYPMWLVGTLGSSDSKVAQEYGPDLWRATHLSWEESRRAAASADDANAIYDEKADLWEETAEKVKAADRGAYEVLTGADLQTRGAATFLLLGAVAAVLPMVGVAAVLLLMAYLVIRVATPGSLVIAPLALYTKGGEKMALAAAGYVGVALRNAVVFGAALALFVPFVAGVLAAAIPLWLALLILAALTVAFLRITKPIRSLGMALVPKSVKRAAKMGAGLYVAGKVGEHAVEEALEDNEERREDDQREKTKQKAAPAEAAAPVDVGMCVHSAPPGHCTHFDCPNTAYGTTARQSGGPQRTALATEPAGTPHPAGALPAGTSCPHGAEPGRCSYLSCPNSAYQAPAPEQSPDGTFVAPSASHLPAAGQSALFAAQSEEGLRSAEDQYRVEREQRLADGAAGEQVHRVDWGATPTLDVDWTGWPGEIGPSGGEPFAADMEVDPATGNVVHHVIYEPSVAPAAGPAEESL